MGVTDNRNDSTTKIEINARCFLNITEDNGSVTLLAWPRKSAFCKHHKYLQAKLSERAARKRKANRSELRQIAKRDESTPHLWRETPCLGFVWRFWGSLLQQVCASEDNTGHLFEADVNRSASVERKVRPGVEFHLKNPAENQPC